MGTQSVELDFLKTIYSKKHDEQSLLQAIDSLLNMHDRLSAKAFSCYIGTSFFKSLLANEFEEVRIISRNGNVYFFEYMRQIKSKKSVEELVGKFYIVENCEYENVFTVITIDSSAFFSNGLLRFFCKFYPQISLTFITHKKLKKIMVDFRDTHALKDFTIVRTSMKSRVGKKVMSSVNWPTFTLEKAFDWVNEENGWFERLQVKAQKGNSPIFSMSISRDGIVKSDNFFGLIYKNIISAISKTVHDNVVFFGKRARLENGGEIRPVSLVFEPNHFKLVEENKKFIEAMDKMKSASVSVIHGNPYVQLSVFDYYDGSSYDMWVLSNDKIIIVPQLKSTFQAIKRLINHVFDNYYEADIKEYEGDA